MELDTFDRRVDVRGSDERIWVAMGDGAFNESLHGEFSA